MNNCLIVGEKIHEYILDTFVKKNFKITEYKEGQALDNTSLVFFSNNVGLDLVCEIVKKINNLENSIFIFLSKKFNSVFIKEIHKIYYYPLKVSSFESFLETFSFYKSEYRNIIINGNYVINLKNLKKTYFTETQINIFKILVNLKDVEKDMLKKDVLNIKNILDTKSLESHLSRIRKKLIEIDSDLSIISTDNKKIKLL